MSTEYFELTSDHVKLVKNFWVGWQPDEYGAPEVDPKKPYGNSDVERDIAEILGWIPEAEDWGDPALSEDQRNDAHRLHKETAKALQVVLRSGSFEPGRYQSEQYHRNWTLVEQPVEKLVLPPVEFSVGDAVRTTVDWNTRLGGGGDGYAGRVCNITDYGPGTNPKRRVQVLFSKPVFWNFDRLWFDPEELELDSK